MSAGADDIREHYDAQDNYVPIAYLPETGLGPAVVFDGGGFRVPRDIRNFARDLTELADRLEKDLNTAAADHSAKGSHVPE